MYGSISKLNPNCVQTFRFYVTTDATQTEGAAQDH